MGISQHNQDLDLELISNLKDERDWVQEVNNLVLFVSKLDELGKVTSVREIAKVTKMSKSWVSASLVLAKGFKLYPEIIKFRNRNKAYNYLIKKNKIRRLLE